MSLEQAKCTHMKNKILEGLYVSAALVSSTYSKQYHGDMENLVRGYGHDIALPFGMYFGLKLVHNTSSSFSAAYVFLGCSTFEIFQNFGLYHGTFDPYDFLAYGTGVGLALGLDKLTLSKNNLETLVTEK